MEQNNELQNKRDENIIKIMHATTEGRLNGRDILALAERVKEHELLDDLAEFNYLNGSLFSGLVLAVGTMCWPVMKGYGTGLNDCDYIREGSYATLWKVFDKWGTKVKIDAPRNELAVTPEEYVGIHGRELRRRLESFLSENRISQKLLDTILLLYEDLPNFQMQMCGMDGPQAVKGYMLFLRLAGILPQDKCNEIMNEVMTHYRDCINAYRMYEPPKAEEEAKPVLESKTYKEVMSTQVGGDHYSKYKMQPVEAIRKMNLDFVKGNILKYLVRYKDKNGIEDLKKARHYAEILRQHVMMKLDVGELFREQFVSSDPGLSYTMSVLFGNGSDLSEVRELMELLDARIQQEENKDDPLA